MNSEKIRELCLSYRRLAGNGITSEKLNEYYDVLIELVDKSWTQKALGGKKRFEAFRHIVKNLKEIARILSKLNDICQGATE